MTGKGLLTIPNFLKTLELLYEDQEYLVYYDRRYSYKDFLKWTGRISKGLLNLGFKEGDRLVIWVSNFPEWMALWFACQRIGVIPVPVNTRFRKQEISYILRNSKAKGIAIMGNYLNIDYRGRVEEMIPEIALNNIGEWVSEDFPLLKHVISVDENCPLGSLTLTQVEHLGERLFDLHLDRAEGLVQPTDVACLLFTSGTTSFPKGVLLAHEQIIINGWKSGDRLGLVGGDRFLAVLPLFGSFMCLNGIFSVTSHRGCIVLQDHFDASEALRLIEEERITVIYGPDTVFRDIINHPDRSKRDISSWKKGVGAPLHVKTLGKLIELGVSGMVHGYGLTETAAICASGDPENKEETRFSTIGQPLPGIEIDIFDSDTGKFVEQGESGEIVVKGSSLLLGYEGKPLQTVESTLSGGWFRTGDFGKISSTGDLVLLGRLKDMLKVGGFSVATQEIEEFLSTFPEVEEAAVVGIPDERLQEVPAAFIKLLPGKTLSIEEVMERCQQIANFKRPREVQFVESFPLTETGKIKKIALREFIPQ
jgi:fatty-acyl-CoA synthase